MNLEYKKKVIKSFSDNAESYHDKATIQRKVSKSLAGILPKMENPRILEVGCGTGILTEFLIKKYPNASFEITDISGSMLEECKKRCDRGKIKFFEMDGEKPLQNLGRYDLVVSSMTLHWFEYPLVGIQRLAELGPLFYATIGENNFFEWQNAVCMHADKKAFFPVQHLPGIINEEYFKLKCSNFSSFAKELKSMGVLLKHEKQVLLSYENLSKALKTFRQKNNAISWHIVYGIIK